MIFYLTGQHNGTERCFHLYDTRFAIVEEYKYLGVLISSKRNESKGMEREVDSVVYHAGLKELLYLPKRCSNHYVRKILNSLTFENFRMKHFYFNCVNQGLLAFTFINDIFNI